MKEIAIKKGTSLYLKVFESKKFDCILFVYFNKDNEVVSVSFQWGTDTIITKYLERNDNGEATKLYRMFKDILGSHSAKIYDMIIGAHSLTNVTRLKLADCETLLAEAKMKNKNLRGKLDKVLFATKEFA